MKEQGMGLLGGLNDDSHSYSDDSEQPKTKKKAKKSPDEGKKEKNIKRRVYDALNV